MVEGGKTFLRFHFFFLDCEFEAEDNANAEDAATYRCKHSSFETILFI